MPEYVSCLSVLKKSPKIRTLINIHISFLCKPAGVYFLDVNKNLRLLKETIPLVSSVDHTIIIQICTRCSQILELIIVKCISCGIVRIQCMTL